MPDYAGASKAIRDRFVAAWGTTTPVQIQNTDPPLNPWPPSPPVPWVYLEVLNSTSELRGAGLPGDHVWLYTGNIFVHIFVPINYGIDDVEAFAVQAGEIYRAQTFYNEAGTGVKVICGAPMVQGGLSDADEGNWYRLTCMVPFEYYHRG